MYNNATAALAMVGVFVGMAAFGAWNQKHREVTVIEVVGKERVPTKDSAKNFVYSSSETYIVKDSIWNGHFRAGTVYAKIPEKGTCQVTLSGRRMGFISSYQNIIAASCETP